MAELENTSGKVVFFYFFIITIFLRIHTFATLAAFFFL